MAVMAMYHDLSAYVSKLTLKLPDRSTVRSYVESTVDILKTGSWYHRGKSLAFLWVHLMVVPVWIFLTFALHTWDYVKFSSGKDKVNPARRRVLVTGSPMTKCLHIVRILGKAGHEVILADSEEYFHTAAKFSRYVTKFRTLANIQPNDHEEYVDSLIRVAKEEQVDWFVPVSHIKSSVPDCVAAKTMRRNMGVKCFTFDDPATAEILDDKVAFLRDCQELGFSVPNFKLMDTVQDLKNLQQEGAFDEDKHYFLKPLNPCTEDRLNFTRIPGDNAAFEKYLQAFEGKISLQNPYFVTEFIQGKELASNVLCSNGEILAVQVAPSSAIQIDYDVIAHAKVLEWTRDYCKIKGLTGFVCFDFLEDAKTGQIFCLECNPRLHSSITSYVYNPDVESALKFALEPDYSKASIFPISPSRNAPHVYWAYNELQKVANGQLKFQELLDIVRNGKEATVDPRDPLPFLLLPCYQMPIQLLVHAITGDKWNMVNPCIGLLR